MISKVYGKRMENLGKRINVRPVNNEKDCLKHVSKPTFISQKIFDKNFAAIHEIKPVLILIKPIYVGFTVLELSKWLMYDFHYNFIKKILILIYCLLIQTVLLMKSNQKMFFFNTNTHLFDLSEFQSTFFNPTDKRVIGKMKDEFKGIPINKCIGLKSKINCIVSNDYTEVNTEKRVNISTEFNEYEDFLLNEKKIRHKMKRIQSKKT